MNKAAASINQREKELDESRLIHRNFLSQFTTNLLNAKEKITEKQIQNSEFFYLTMREGQFII